MTTRKHVHEEVFDAGAETIFALLHTPSAIRQWWGASHVIVDQRESGVWVGVWGDEDSPEFITAGRMSVFDPPHRIVFSDFEYYARKGPLPFAANLPSKTAGAGRNRRKSHFSLLLTSSGRYERKT